jgi:hypothetical protein
MVVADGVVEGEGEVQGEFGVRHARRTDPGAQHVGAVVDVGVGAAGVAGERRDIGDQGGGAQIRAGQELLSEGEFVVGDDRVVKARAKARCAWLLPRSPVTPWCSASSRAAAYAAAARSMAPWGHQMSPSTRWWRPSQPPPGGVADPQEPDSRERAQGNLLGSHARRGR